MLEHRARARCQSTEPERDAKAQMPEHRARARCQSIEPKRDTRAQMLEHRARAEASLNILMVKDKDTRQT